MRVPSPGLRRSAKGSHGSTGAPETKAAVERQGHYCPGWLLKSDYSTGMNQANNRAQNRDRIGKKHQDETADSCIKGFVADNLVHVRLRQAEVAQSSLRASC